MLPSYSRVKRYSGALTSAGIRVNRAMFRAGLLIVREWPNSGTSSGEKYSNVPLSVSRGLDRLQSTTGRGLWGTSIDNCVTNLDGCKAPL